MFIELYLIILCLEIYPEFPRFRMCPSILTTCQALDNTPVAKVFYRMLPMDFPTYMAHNCVWMSQ